MAKVHNPRKGFNFSIEIINPVDGATMEPYLVQKVNLPDVDIEQVSHGDANYDIKTAGRKKVGNLSLEKLMPSEASDTYLWNWGELCQSIPAGGGTHPDIHKATIIIREYDEAGDGLNAITNTPIGNHSITVRAINTWVAEGCWPTKFSGLPFDRMASENSIEKMEFSVDAFYKLPYQTII